MEGIKTFEDTSEITALRLGERKVAKILHTGDAHFDDFDRLSDIVESAKNIIKHAQNELPDLIVISGDIANQRLLHDSAALSYAVDFVRQMAAVAPVFLLKGTTTHDGLSVMLMGALQTKNRVYVSEKIEMVGFKSGVFTPIDQYVSGLDAIIYALPPVSKAKLVANGNGIQEGNANAEDLLQDVFITWGEVSRFARQDGVPTMISGHGTVRGAVTSTGQQMVGREIEYGTADLALADADLVLLAHIHKAQSWGNIFYCGSIAKLNVGESEDKGFWFHEFTENGFESRFVILPTRDIISVEFEGVPDIDALPLVTPGAIVRVRYKISEEAVHTVNEDAIRQFLYSQGASEVRIEKTVVITQATRAQGISQESSLEDKLIKWGELTGTDIPASLIQKLWMLHQPLDITCQELGLKLKNGRKK